MSMSKRRVGPVLAAVWLLTSACGGGGGGSATSGGTTNPAARYGRVAGRVTDELTGEAVVKAAVSVKDQTMAAETDDAGRFELLNVPVGRRTLVITKQWYTIPEAQVDVAENQMTNIEIRCREYSDPPVFSALTAAPAQLEFTGGTAVVTAEVSDPNGNQVRLWGKYDLGSFDLTPVGNGKHVFSLDLPSNQTNTARVYTVTVTASDRVNVVDATVLVTVKPLQIAGGTGAPGSGGSSGSGGGDTGGGSPLSSNQPSGGGPAVPAL